MGSAAPEVHVAPPTAALHPRQAQLCHGGDLRQQGEGEHRVGGAGGLGVWGGGLGDRGGIGGGP